MPTITSLTCQSLSYHYNYFTIVVILGRARVRVRVWVRVRVRVWLGWLAHKITTGGLENNYKRTTHICFAQLRKKYSYGGFDL